jgi:hypothetical protein
MRQRYDTRDIEITLSLDLTARETHHSKLADVDAHHAYRVLCIEDEICEKLGWTRPRTLRQVERRARGLESERAGR